MDGGWIKIHRKILDWEWYTTPNMVQVFLHCLFSANYEDRIWHGIKVERGSFITSIGEIGQKTGLSVRQTRTCISRLKTTSELTIKTTNKYSIVTVCKYVDYQLSESFSDKQNDKQTVTQTTNKNSVERQQLKNIYNNKETKETNKETSSIELVKKNASVDATLARAKIFYDSLTPFVPIYGKEMVRDFYNWWSEMNKSKTKMNFEYQKTWDVERRLRTWEKREKQYGRNNKPTAGANNNASAANKAASRRDLEAAADRILGEP